MARAGPGRAGRPGDRGGRQRVWPWATWKPSSLSGMTCIVPSQEAGRDRNDILSRPPGALRAATSSRCCRPGEPATASAQGHRPPRQSRWANGHVHVGPTVLGSCDSLARPRPVSTRGSGVLGRAGLDVQGGLLAGEEPEHGGGHGLHVDLPRRGMSACPRCPSRPPGIALATAAVAVCVEEELEGRPGGWGHRSAP